MASTRSLLVLAALPAALALNNGLARTPQMGWNTWNHFGCSISEDTIVSAAKALVSNNLTAYGYECESACVSSLVYILNTWLVSPKTCWSTTVSPGRIL